MFGAVLYGEDGSESASFIGANSGEAAQVCPFEIKVPCRYFETDEKALTWLASLYKDSAQ